MAKDFDFRDTEFWRFYKKVCSLNDELKIQGCRLVEVRLPGTITPYMLDGVRISGTTLVE